MKSLLRECFRRALIALPRHDERYKHFSFIIVRNEIISYGKNRRGSDAPINYPDHAMLHSEYEAVRRGLRRIVDGFDCVNIRFNQFGNLKISAPCSACTELLRNAGCRSVYFSTETNFARMWL